MGGVRERKEESDREEWEESKGGVRERKEESERAGGVVREREMGGVTV